MAPLPALRNQGQYQSRGQLPIPTLLDSQGNPFRLDYPGDAWQAPPAPAGSNLPVPYGPTTIIIESGGGKIELTESDAARTISYADIYATQPAVAAVVNKLVRQASTLPITVYQRPANNQTVSYPGPGAIKPGHPVPITDPTHSLVSLLNKPAPGYGTVSLLEWITMPLYVHGNSVIAKFRDDPAGPPVVLFPLDWRFLYAWARIGTPVLMWASLQTGYMKLIPPSDTIFTAWNSPAGMNGAWLGTSPLQQLGVTIKIDEAAQRYAAANFKNAARPSGFIQLPPTVNVQQNPEITDRVRDAVEGSYGGVDKAFRIAVLGGGAEWKPWAQTAGEAQLVETRTWNRDEIAMLFDVDMRPGDTMNPERDAQFYKTTLRKELTMIADRLNFQLVDPEPEWKDLFVRIEMDQVLYGDPLVLSDKLVAEVDAGIISIDEARISLGRAPRGGVADELTYLTARQGQARIGTEAVAAAEVLPAGAPPEPLE